MAESLRSPLLFPNWVWLLGAGLVLLALVWGVSLLVAYRRSRVLPQTRLHSLSEVRLMRYDRLIGEVEQEFADGKMTAREAHLSISALIRAAASERLRANVESVSVADARGQYWRWPLFADALTWCEQPSFGAGADQPISDPQAQASVSRGLDYARQVVRQ